MNLNSTQYKLKSSMKPWIIFTLVSVSDITPTDCWLNVWCINHTKWESFKVFIGQTTDWFNWTLVFQMYVKFMA